MTIKVSCHCGKVAIEVPHKPEFLNICQCSNCRKHGVAWGYYEISNVAFVSPKPSSEKVGTMDAGRELEGVGAYMWKGKIRAYCYCEACAYVAPSPPLQTVCYLSKPSLIVVAGAWFTPGPPRKRTSRTWAST